MIKNINSEYTINQLLKNIPIIEIDKKIFYYTFTTNGIKEFSYVNFDTPNKKSSSTVDLRSRNAQDLDKRIRETLKNRKDEIDIRLQGVYKDVDLADKIQNNEIYIVCGKNHSLSLKGKRNNDSIKLPKQNTWDIISDLSSEEIRLNQNTGEVLFKTNFLNDLIKKSTLDFKSKEEAAFVLNYYKTSNFDVGKSAIDSNSTIARELSIITKSIIHYFAPRLNDNKKQLYIEIVGFADNQFDSIKVSKSTGLTLKQRNMNQRIVEARASQVKKWLEINLGPDYDYSIEPSLEKYFFGNDRNVEIKAWVRDKKRCSFSEKITS